MFFKNRTCFSIASATALILLIASFRNQKDISKAAGQAKADRFWAMKARNKSKYDMLIIGDSRAYRGVDPDVMQKFLPQMSIYNFAFSSGSLNPEIFQAAGKMLNVGGSRKTILMGVSPGCLTTQYEGNTQYNIERGRPYSAYIERVYLNNKLVKFSPLFYVWPGDVTNNDQVVYISNYHDNGWVGSHKEPEDTDEALPLYRSEMEKYKVNPELVAALIQQTREWTLKGIHVFAFRPPTTRSMFNLENDLSGFDEKTLIQQFETAGGVWIPVNLSQYHSYDGSHIDEASAKRLSAYIAKEIAKKYK